MNLIYDSWIPVKKRNGEKVKISPCEITENISTDLEYTDISSVRPDFDGALIQFLIGLLQTTCAPQNTQEWFSWFNKPPDKEELKKKFNPIAQYFNLDGNGPRFMQETTLQFNKNVIAEGLPISKMLIDMPGENTIKNNMDFFIKEGNISYICSTCCAIALFTMQTNAPTGGQGHLTGLRGGGPLTTIVTGSNLWQTCWLNILNGNDFLQLGNSHKDKDSDRFPWITCERISVNGLKTTPADVHPAQIYWAMPRRFLLIFENKKSSICDLCGRPSETFVKTYFSLPRGIDYAGQWEHPLSPMYKKETTTEDIWLPVHQHERIGYRHWLGLIPNLTDEKHRPALAISETINRIQNMDVKLDLKIRAFGYDMDNMKACSWNEAVFPVINIEDKYREMYGYYMKNMINAADLGCNYLRRAIKDAWKIGKICKDTIILFWEKTEPPFYTAAANLIDTLQENPDSPPTVNITVNILENWLKVIIDTSQRIFDIFSQAGDFKSVDPGRVARAWNTMNKNLYGRKMRETLGLPLKKEVADAKSR